MRAVWRAHRRLTIWSFRLCAAPVLPTSRMQVLLFYAPQTEGLAKRIAKVSQCVQLCTVRSLVSAVNLPIVRSCRATQGPALSITHLVCRVCAARGNK
jgi:hypothetical protein